MLKKTWVLVATFLLFLCSSEAESKNVAGWEVGRSDRHCQMLMAFENGVIVSFLWYPVEQHTGLSLVNGQWSSLQKRNGKQASVRLELAGRYVEHVEWWDNGALITANEDVRGVSGRWGSTHANSFATSIMLADSMQILVDGQNIGFYNLSGSYKAMLQLRKCGFDLLKDTKRPFAL